MAFIAQDVKKLSWVRGRLQELGAPSQNLARLGVNILRLVYFIGCGEALGTIISFFRGKSCSTLVNDCLHHLGNVSHYLYFTRAMVSITRKSKA